MAQTRFQKVRIFFPAAQRAEVLRALQTAGVLEITPDGAARAPQPATEKLRENLARAEFLVEFLGKFADEKSRAAAIPATPDEARARAGGFDSTATEAAERLEVSLTEIDDEIAELRAEREELAPWQNLRPPLHHFRGTRHTAAELGEIAAADWPAFRDEIIKKHHPASLRVISRTDEKVRFFLIGFRATGARRAAIWEKFAAKKIELPLRRGSVGTELERLDRRIKKLDRERAAAEKKCKKMAREVLPEAKILRDELAASLARSEAGENLWASARAGSVVGWIRRRDRAGIDAVVGAAAPVFLVEDAEVGAGETPPVEIVNKKIIRPFESVTELYGLPGIRELDPTPALAAFFFIFFGFALTDLGYGIVLAGLAFGARIFLAKKTVDGRPLLGPAVKKMLTLLGYGGIATVLGGLLFGSVFGVKTAILGDWATDLQKFDPLGNPMAVLKLSLALGVTHILWAMVLDMIVKWRRGDRAAAILDSGPWIWTIGWGLAWALVPAAAVFAKIPTLAGIAALVLTQGRDQKSILGKLGIGVLKLYDFIGFASDVLSYSRLLALGLATGIIAMTVNLIAGLVAGPEPGLGWIGAAAILVVGHTFNLAINILGAFIHSARLQYIEFFKYFFEGGGRPFRPFAREDRFLAPAGAGQK